MLISALGPRPPAGAGHEGAEHGDNTLNISLLESRMHLIGARTVWEQGVSSNPGPQVSVTLQLFIIIEGKDL